MIKGFHVLLSSADPKADREFLRDTLALTYVDSHDGWLICALPPAELGVHPRETEGEHTLFLMCDDVETTTADLESTGARFIGGVSDDEGVGRFATLSLPGGGTMGPYEPTHATPLPGWPTSRPAETRFD